MVYENTKPDPPNDGAGFLQHRFTLIAVNCADCIRGTIVSAAQTKLSPGHLSRRFEKKSDVKRQLNII
jgi:hypothetical protein